MEFLIIKLQTRQVYAVPSTFLHIADRYNYDSWRNIQPSTLKQWDFLPTGKTSHYGGKAQVSNKTQSAKIKS
ncbi:MAG: hypothetical protein LBG15_03500 [Dysgonamonadaceae bacterium]|nr:hypothetical protein [Dysgonamonadaceae bacterium]